MEEKTKFASDMKAIAKYYKSKLELNENDVHCALKINNLVNLNFYFDTYRKKINVTLSYNRETGLSYNSIYDRELKELTIKISMAPTKSAELMIKDINRRFFENGTFTKYTAIIQENVDLLNKANDKKRLIQLDVEFLHKNINDFWRYEDGKKRSLVINKEYGDIEISCNKLSRELILKIVKMIDKELY